MLFVVRRSFRNFNQMMVPGSVVEPGTIKRFKSRLRDRDIIQIDEQDLDKWNKYFSQKFGTGIIMPAKPEVKKPEVKKPEVKKPEVKKPATVVKAN